MQQKNTSLIPRRSSRVQTAIPVLVTSLDPSAHFSEVCETVVVNAHGCAMRSRRKVETGSRLRLRSRDGRDTTGQVVSCQPVGADDQSWILGTTLDRPDNFWGMRNCPKDWVAAAVPGLVTSVSPSLPATAGITHAPQPSAQPADLAIEKNARQRAEEYIKVMFADAIRPLQAEVAALNEKLQRKEPSPSRFDVSLSKIPPELEQQLEARLRNNLDPRIVEQARQQSAHVLAKTQSVIDSSLKKAQEHLAQLLGEEHQTLRQQAQKISGEISTTMRDRLNLGMDEFKQKLVDGGNRLEHLSQELLGSMQSSLSEEHNARLGEIDQLRGMIKTESLRLQECTGRLECRIEKLNDSVQSLESGLDHRLGEMYSRVVKDTRAELENAAGAIFNQFTTRSAEALAAQQERACEALGNVEKGTTEAFSLALEGKVRAALRAFEESTQEMAKTSVERWSSRLGASLAGLAKSLEDQFQMD